MTDQFICQYQYSDGFKLDASFTIPPGITGLSGPSGSGKTTILLLLAGLLKPNPGRIVVGSKLLVDTTTGKWVAPEHRAVGMVFQNNLLFPHKNVRDNLLYGVSRKPFGNIKLEDVVGVLELGDLLDRRPNTLSGGQSRRVAIGRALLRGPELLILDEPWVGLEYPLRDRIVKLVQRCLNEWNIPTLIVSHEMDYLRTLTQQVIELNHGVTRELPV